MASVIINGIEYFWFRRGDIWHVRWWAKRKKVSRSTKCRTKKEAKAVIATWRPETGTLRECAGYLLDLDLRHKKLKPNTIYSHKNDLDKILESLGDIKIGELTPKQVDDWLFSLTCKGSTKNTVIDTLNIVLREAEREGIIQRAPRLRRYQRESVRKDILTDAEIKMLFPADELDQAKIWGDWSHALLFAVMLQSGMRPPEARALHVEQLYPEHNTILIDR